MPNFNSTQHAAIQPPNYAPLKPNELGGRVRSFYAEYTVEAAFTTGDNIVWGRLPKGARIIRGNVAWEAMGGTAAIGVSLDALDDLTGSTNVLGQTTSVNAGNAAIAPTVALNFGYETTRSGGIVFSNISGSDPTTGAKVRIQIDYVVD